MTTMKSILARIDAYTLRAFNAPATHARRAR